MPRLVVKNLGPIKWVDIELKRFNVFVGRQSSGKSTIAKVISSCLWIEKECATTLSTEFLTNSMEFEALIGKFHKIEGYFRKDTVIKFDSNIISLNYDRLEGEFFIVLKDRYAYTREKISYIPAERNMVVLPELQGFEFGPTNIRSFLFDWLNARWHFDVKHKTGILNLDVKYYYDESESRLKDRVEHVNGETYEISLANASSGLQSVVPLSIMLQYYAGQYFDDYGKSLSFNMEAKQKKLYETLFIEMMGLGIINEHGDLADKEKMDLANNALNADFHRSLQNAHEFMRIYRNLSIPSKCAFIIEEPEQNLYPITQLSLMDMIAGIYSDGKKHMLTITTHSPYIVNYLNVLLRRKNQQDGIESSDLAVCNVSDGRLQNLIASDLETGEVVVDSYSLSEPMENVFDEYRSLMS